VTPAAALATADCTEERKRLGQFFTGEPLARLLAALAQSGDARTVIDPMAGSGDMLVAVRQVGSSESALTAVEIDPVAALRCSQRLRPGGELESATRVGDAFSVATWADLSDQAWDLVITNPPYVRYQRSTRRGTGRVALPSATDVRRGLQAILGARTTLSLEDRQAFIAVAKAYSGLADLAVPAWILCAGLVSTGGRLAMVLPDTWLSRDYAIPVLYLLRRYFEIECVVEDGEAAWFEDALVRTTLLVARRVEDRGTALHDADTGHLHVRLDAVASNSRSVVGAIDPDEAAPEKAFAERIRELSRSRGVHATLGVNAVWTPDDHLRDLIERSAHRSAWMFAIEPRRLAAAGGDGGAPGHLPRQIRTALDGRGLEQRTIGTYGWRVGQGLRTGGNRFFYGECLREMGNETLLSVDSAISSEPVLVPKDVLRPVVRKQQDLVVAHGDPSRSRGRLLDLSRFVLAEDAASVKQSLGDCPYETMPEPLAEHVRRAAELNVGTPDEPRLLPDLSAVATNVRRAHRGRPGQPPRFWYQLPALAPRHVPDLFVPRINHGYSSTVVNSGVVIDANFSTLWRESKDALSVLAMLALLHSTWVSANLEASATVLGGGALKLEATHLLRLSLPSIDPSDAQHLDRLGAELVSDVVNIPELISNIDEVVWRRVVREPTGGDPVVEAVTSIAMDLMNRRSPHRMVKQRLR
jgi:predicted RNA methylase